MKTRITELLKIKYPIIQGGMVWVSGWKLASAVSEAGGLGLLGAGSMKPDLLREHIKKCKLATDKPFGVNIPLFREDSDQLIKACIEEEVKIFFTSAGHPAKYIELLKANNCIVIHVVPSLKFAIKAESAGCDAVVGEGVEAGGHNGADQITVFCLIPSLAESLKIPIIAAGGISNARGIIAAMALGADGAQIGTLFAATEESSAHEIYKRKIIEAKEDDTALIFKKIGLIRSLKNSFVNKVIKAEEEGASADDLKELLAKKREMKGIFEGDLEEGLMEAGQASVLIKEIYTVKEVMKKLIEEAEEHSRNIIKLIK